jgi:hypothetical protein
LGDGYCAFWLILLTFLEIGYKLAEQQLQVDVFTERSTSGVLGRF